MSDYVSRQVQEVVVAGAELQSSNGQFQKDSKMMRLTLCLPLVLLGFGRVLVLMPRLQTLETGADRWSWDTIEVKLLEDRFRNKERRVFLREPRDEHVVYNLPKKRAAIFFLRVLPQVIHVMVGLLIWQRKQARHIATHC
jgi:hypothetical protein